MQLFTPQVPSLFKRSQNVFRQISLRRAALMITCAAVAVSAALAAGLGPPTDAIPGATGGLLEAGQSAELKLANLTGQIEAQIMQSDGKIWPNPEAFNLRREKDIANDSQKLLKLAIALKAEIDGNSGAEPSADALVKAQEIEKLAKDLKSRMAVNPVLERPKSAIVFAIRGAVCGR
jgi:hypothetical protein